MTAVVWSWLSFAAGFVVGFGLILTLALMSAASQADDRIERLTRHDVPQRPDV